MAKPNTLDDCYCVCHSTFSSCAYCEHCKGDNVVSRAMQPPNTDTLDEQIDKILDRHMGFPSDYLLAGESQTVKELAKQQLKALFTEHSKQAFERGKYFGAREHAELIATDSVENPKSCVMPCCLKLAAQLKRNKGEEMKYRIRTYNFRIFIADILWISGHFLKVLSEKLEYKSAK